jgi:hypothetical protein
MKYHCPINKAGMLPKQASESIKKELLLFAGKRVTITIEKYKKIRSNEQNAYYHGVIIKIISDYTGYSKEEVHELLKKEFIGKKTVKIGDREVEIGESTTKLTTTDFMGYISEIQQWCSETIGLYLPDPNEIEKEYK